MPAPYHRLFLSAASADFSDHRAELDRRLRPAFEIRTQEMFAPGTSTLLRKLDAYINACDVVVHIVGDHFGSVPTIEEIQELYARHPDFLANHPELRSNIDASLDVPSYTQWEAYLALHHKKKMLVFLPHGEAGPSGDDRQRQHLQRLISTGQDRSIFADPQDLALRVFQALVNAGLLASSPVHRRPNNSPFGTIESLFKGREKELDELGHTLERDGLTAILQPQTIHGLGGIGKTRLAIEYAWRNIDRFTAVLFVPANTPRELDASLATLAGPTILDLPVLPDGSENATRASVIRWLQTNRDWLLIFDNVDTDAGVEAVSKLVPQLTGGQILITSRVTRWGRSIGQLSLEVIETEDASALLLESTQQERTTRDTDRDDAGALAKRLGNLPLALTHSAAYIGYHELSIAQYIELFDENIDQILEYHDPNVMEYGSDSAGMAKTVATTFSISFDQLAPAEKGLFQAACFLAPEPIPQAMFEEGKEKLDDLIDYWCELHGETKGASTVRDALSRLASFSLLTRRSGKFQIHRMVQQVLRSRVSAQQSAVWTRKVRALLYEWAPEESAENPRTWPIWDQLRPHAEELVELEDRYDIEPHAELTGALAALYFGKGLYQVSLDFEQRALVAAERLEGPDSGEVASRLLGLGESLRMMGRPEDALIHFRRCQEIRAKLQGADSPGVANSLNYIALALGNMGRREEEESCYRRAIAIYEEQGEKAESDSFAKTLNNLAVIRRSDGDLEEAERLLRRAVELTRDKAGSKPQLAIICALQLARLLDGRGHDDEVESLLHHALDQASVFPEAHSMREIAVESLAKFLRRTQRIGEAREVYTQLEARRRAIADEEDLRLEPEINIRTKLRLCEAVLRFDGSGQPIPGAEASDEFNPHKDYGQHPPSFKGMSILDLENLSLDWSVDCGTAKDLEPDELRRVTRVLIGYFLSAISIDEANQWANQDGTMPDEIRGTLLGGALRTSACALGRRVAALVRDEDPIRSAVREACRVRGDADDTGSIPVLELEVWISPGNASVYTGELTDGLEKMLKQGLSHVFISAAPLEAYCELRPVRRRAADDERVGLEPVLGEHLLPAIRTAANEAEDFGLLRQVYDSMVIATWFKENFRDQFAVTRYLETGSVLLKPTFIEVKGQRKGAEDELRFSLDEAVMVHGPRSTEVALAMNQLSVELRNRGAMREARELARDALAIDLEQRGADHPKIPHRMGNLATLLIMTGDLEAARSYLARAWAKKQGARDVTVGRLLVIRTLAAVLSGEKPSLYLGQLKTLFALDKLPTVADIATTWAFAPVIEQLGPRLTAPDRMLLEGLGQAVNDRGRAATLEAIGIWRDQQPIDLAEPWPD